MLEKLTKVQRETFNKLSMYIADNGNVSIRTLRDYIDKDISHIAILDRLKLLEKKGYVKNIKGKWSPTHEGIKQYIKDTDSPERLKVIRRK